MKIFSINLLFIAGAIEQRLAEPRHSCKVWCATLSMHSKNLLSLKCETHWSL